ncbi:hypothetical protein [Brevibacillus sp. SYSU BS000544]|uniref:hypothetical protein n=1 Tax=Brevibacillus sp. SYSU BS000544 TaxID=3416443 RepID=UPI003CE4D286
MEKQSKLRKTMESLSSAGLVICGRLFEIDDESLTVHADNAHYEVLLEYIANANELASAKQGDKVEVLVLPNATIVEKRLIKVNMPGIITSEVFWDCFDDSSDVSESARDVIARCECSRCVTDCSRCLCDHDCSRCTVRSEQPFAPRAGFRRIRR